MWMLLVLIYGLLKGAREIVKKISLKKNSAMEVLVVYTGIAFFLVALEVLLVNVFPIFSTILPDVEKELSMEPEMYIYVAIKSFVIFIAWILSFVAISRLPLSLYGVLDLSRVLFATCLGVFILGETLKITQGIGLILVGLGLFMLKFRPRPILTLLEKAGLYKEEKAVSPNKEVASKVYVICAFISCLLNAISGLLDKILMKDITSTQLQFWYMLFLFIFYVIFVLIRRIPISKSAITNKWIWLLSIMFVFADKALFIANGVTESKITVMTLIKQSACIVTILGGKLIFKEKNISYKILCACTIIVGILFGII